MLEMLESDIYGNGVSAWGLAAIVAMGVLFVALSAKAALLRHLPEKAPSEELHWPSVLREVVERTSPIFLVIASLYAGAALLSLPHSVANFVFSFFVIALFIQCALWADRLVATTLVWHLAPRKAKETVRNALSLIQFLVRVAVWSLALLLIFENLGFDVTALVAGLGIGGIAVALAAQSMLGDLFSSLAIVLDRPFEVGDFIVFDQQSGTVERIGIKTTRLRSLSGEQIVCSNSDLLATRIHNYKRMAERRVLFSLGTIYETPLSKLETIPGMLKEIIEAQKLVRFERAHFQAYGDSALQFEVVYWVLSADYKTFMDIQQAINFAIFRKFQDEGIEFAYPTRTLYAPELRAVAKAMASRAEQPRLHASAGGE